MTFDFAQLNPASRVLLGPGPSDVPPRILKALALPTLGHLDPQYLQIMDDVGALLRDVMRTTNRLTMAIPGTGSAGMEACFANLVEPGDHVLVCIAGVFGGRMADVAERYGATVHRVEVPWGQTLEPDAVADALRSHPEIRLVAIVHAETSTGAHQPLEAISRLVHDAGALLLVDAVTSLGGVELEVDRLGIDAVYSGTQKCLSCPPGLAPVSLSDRAVAKLDARKSKVANWYLDLTMIRRYWDDNRAYHHTAPVNMTYALREALQMVLEEGLEARISRHEVNGRALRAGLEALGLSYVPARSLPMLHAVRVPEGIDEAAVRHRLLATVGIEIGAGLGPLKGKAWRIGLMGASSTRRNVTLLLAALETILVRQGAKITPGAALAAAAAAYEA